MRGVISRKRRKKLRGEDKARFLRNKYENEIGEIED